MASSEGRQLAKALIERSGQLWSEELGLKLERNTPSELFRWLCASILLSTRIGYRQAMKGARALFDAGWTTPEKMAQSTWEDRVHVLNEHGYARYDESTSRMLGENVDLLVRRYHGDLRRLRERAGRDPEQERELLKEFKGIGDVGADIFFREVQGVWDELFPFADKKALAAAKRLRLGSSADDLAGLVPRPEYPRLIAALVRTDLNNEYDALLEAAKA